MSTDAGVRGHYNLFCERLSAHLMSQGYEFPAEEGRLTPLNSDSSSRSILNPSLAGAVLAGPLFAGTAPSSNQDELHEAVTDLHPLCQTAACKVTSGFVYVVALIDADGQMDQQLVGTCALLYTKLQNFKRFSTPMFNTWGFWKKVAPALFDTETVFGEVLIVFNDSARATDFCLGALKICKHHRGATWCLPTVIDLPAKRIEKWNGWPPNVRGGTELLKARDRLFRR
jgi:hypothetical protein